MLLCCLGVNEVRNPFSIFFISYLIFEGALFSPYLRQPSCFCQKTHLLNLVFSALNTAHTDDITLWTSSECLQIFPHHQFSETIKPSFLLLQLKTLQVHQNITKTLKVSTLTLHSPTWGSAKGKKANPLYGCTMVLLQVVVLFCFVCSL